MSRSTTIADDITPSAAPSDDDIRRWKALPRDEQLKRLRQSLTEAKASGVTDQSMDDIKAAAKERLAATRHG